MTDPVVGKRVTIPAPCPYALESDSVAAMSNTHFESEDSREARLLSRSDALPMTTMIHRSTSRTCSMAR